eukprot:748255-Hanusia_phi.AAC.2
MSVEHDDQHASWSLTSATCLALREVQQSVGSSLILKGSGERDPVQVDQDHTLMLLHPFSGQAFACPSMKTSSGFLSTVSSQVQLLQTERGSHQPLVELLDHDSPGGKPALGSQESQRQASICDLDLGTTLNAGFWIALRID